MTSSARHLSYRRRLVVPALLTIAGFAILISLGVWQLQRKAWKENLIATLETQIKAPPVPLPPSSQWPALTTGHSEFRRVSLQTNFGADAKPVYLYTGASALRADVKQAGYFVFAPARLPDGNSVVVNLGYVPADRKAPPSAYPNEITGYIRWPETPGWIVAERNTKDDVWFLRDPAAMAASQGWGTVAPFYIDQEAPVPASGLPRPGPLSVKLKNDHLGYALTWFGLAASLAAVFFAWAARERYDRT